MDHEDLRRCTRLGTPGPPGMDKTDNLARHMRHERDALRRTFSD
jgi:hypothetical protein